MDLSLFLELFLLTDVFFVGVLVAIAVRHAREHFRGSKASKAAEPPATPASGSTITPTEVLTPMMRDQLMRESERHFEASVSGAVAQLQQNLGATASELDQLLRRLGGEIVGNELERYRTELAQLRQQAQTELGTIKSQVDGHKAELEKQVADELAAEKQRLISQIDTKLGDAVSSFLLDALQHNIDMGAQEEYLLQLLETHKDDFKREVEND